MTETRVCKVCIPNTLSYVYDYEVSQELPLLGSRVLVPFRNAEKVGFAWAYGNQESYSRPLKTIIASENTVIFDAHFRQFLEWLSQYYHSPLSEVLALASPKLLKDFKRSLQLSSNMEVLLAKGASEVVETLGARQVKLKRLYEVLSSQGQTSISSLKLLGFSKAHIEKGIELGLCDKTLKARVTTHYKHLDLNAEQQDVMQQIALDAFEIYLLQGVTGSGKTEVYIESMRQVLQKGQQVLMLVPEIGLTSAFFLRLQERLGAECILMHSNLSPKARFEHWLKAYYGHGKLILGTRSAIFAPLPHLGLIIIDEEHDLSFKQLEGIRYSAKDAAIMRAKLSNIPIVLGTATPCLESYQNVLNKKYRSLVLNQKALSKTPLYYQVIDLRAQKTQHGLAQKTLDVIDKHLKQGEQVLIFINRRGYAPLLFCHDCGWSKKCSRCDANMTWYRKRNILQCHHCGSITKTLQQCESCWSAQLMPLGIGTEQVVDFLQSYFPQFKTLRIDRDIIRHKTALDDALQDIQDQSAQLIVGTQMLTKGHHFPQLGLVVVVDADSAFYQSDFRALERLGQLLTQVAGRAGRADVPGEVLIQTHLPKHPLLNCLIEQGYNTFVGRLLTQRQEAMLPPFSYLSLIRAQGKNNALIKAFLEELRQKGLFDQITVLGPVPAPMEKKADIFRWQLILKAQSRKHLHQVLNKITPWIENYTPKGVRCFIEVDPYDWSA